MIVKNTLNDPLRAQKLSGTLDTRLAHARAGELGPLDFLQILCEDELHC